MPQLHCDIPSPDPPHSSSDAHKMIIMIRDWFYAIDAYHPNGTLISPNDMEKRIRSAVWDVGRRMRAGEAAVPVGILSSDERDRWAKVHYLFVARQVYMGVCGFC